MHASQARQLGRSPVCDQYQEVRKQTLRLTQPFSPEDQMLQSMPDASPAKWHLAHTTWFFETFILAPKASGYCLFDERYQHLFNSYYKQLGSHPNRGSRGLMSRPSLEEVHAYRSHVDDAMLRYMDSADDETLALIELGLNHEQQHQELILTDMKHALWSMPLRSTTTSRLRALNETQPLQWVRFEGGIYEVGHAGSGFSFDNETPRHEVLLRPYTLASRLVTNSEYQEFMNEGGYRRPELWLSDGWDAVSAHNWNSPLYWEQRDGTWFEYTLSEMQELDPAAAVCHVSFYEADAYARWSKARLPLEEEWEVAAAEAPVRGNLVETGNYHPGSAHRPSPRREGEELQQIFGDVWEWTSSPYTAYPGFKPAAGLIGEYNGKFMCNQMVLRGGSCATPSSHLRATYRNFFPPHARWQFSGIRLAK